MRNPDRMSLSPLSGVRVLDFTVFPPGAVCSVMLADLGAEVIRVESPSLKGKPSTVFGQVGMSRSKKSMTLDMRHARSSEVLLKMAPGIDVVIENAKPGAMTARGFGFPQAHDANPGLTWCAITGFGQDGPYANHAGHDISYLAHSGLLGALSGDPSFQPAISLAVQLGAMSAVVAIQAALLERAHSGQGSFLDISLSEAAGFMLTAGFNPLSDSPMMIPATADRSLYECGDGRRVAVASAEPRTWQALCEGLGVPELSGKLQARDVGAETTAAIAAVLRTQPAAHWVETLAPMGAAITIANHGSQILSDPQVIARGAVVDVAGTPVPASPFRLSNAEGVKSQTNTSPASNVGDDTTAVLLACGLSQTEIDELAEENLF
jgi:crotonobetainyl-CoA:carnitine CoA-transferase CaiB-like acyl-CoA transferase